MESFSSLFKKEHMGELVLVILLIIYFCHVRIIQKPYKRSKYN